MSAQKVRLALTGLGRIGKVHLRNLLVRLPQAEVVAVSDPNPATRAVAASMGVGAFYTDFEHMLAREQTDAVVICSPTPTHQAYIGLAAEAGKHIFCEKPLDMTLERIRWIAQKVKQEGVKLQVGFNRRFDADFIALREQVKRGAIGEPHLLKITSRDPAPPPLSYIHTSGGLFMDMSIHDFDMARFMLGSEVEEVFAQGMVRVDEEIGLAGDIDTAIIQLKFKDGTLAAIDNSRKAVYGYDQRLEVFGSGGMATNANHYPHHVSHFDQNGSHGPQALHFFVQRYAESYYREMLAFVEALLNDQPVPVNANDALQATRIALAALKSLRERRLLRIEEVD
ncbi:MAG: inositol 2-dehydrogenase [Bacteroidetes bacterium]|nr:MAG: inositol 2-dehydrogenase [Bacteroidota bacterium]